MPSLLADSPGCPISIGKTYQWEDNLVPCKNQSRAMFTKLWEGKKKPHKEKPKTWKPTTGCPCFTHTIIRWHLGFSFYPLLKNFLWAFKDQSKILKTVKVLVKPKQTEKKNPWKLSCMNTICFQREGFCKRKTTTKYSVKGETGLVARAL